MTYRYLKLGPMGKRPFHLLGEGGEVSLCGRVRRGDAGVTTVATAPGPITDGLICERCRLKAAVVAVQRVAALSPFVEAV